MSSNAPRVDTLRYETELVADDIELTRCVGERIAGGLLIIITATETRTGQEVTMHFHDDTVVSIEDEQHHSQQRRWSGLDREHERLAQYCHQAHARYFRKAA